MDYGLGNLGSMKNMLKKLNANVIISESSKDIKSANKLILPGVGAFDNGMSNLIEMGLIEVLEQKVLKEKVPILGVCLGMQLLTNKSEEGEKNGLGWINAETIKFKFDSSDRKYTIPHMGWNFINQTKESRLLENLPEQPRFYFTHSFFIKCNDSSDELTTTVYNKKFISSFQKDNIYGVQFHPEKSHKYGMKLLQNFIEL